MGELAEEFREMREYQKVQRWKRYEENMKHIIASGHLYREYGNGQIVIGNYDFWATTGTFINRRTRKKSRGVKKLLSLLSKEVK